MRYDVEERVKDWLVSGRKRGDFMAKVCMKSYHLVFFADGLIGWRGTCSSSHSHPTASWRVSVTTGDCQSITHADCARDAERKLGTTKFRVLST
jgi:hypothetical protein